MWTKKSVIPSSSILGIFRKFSTLHKIDVLLFSKYSVKFYPTTFENMFRFTLDIRKSSSNFIPIHIFANFPDHFAFGFGLGVTKLQRCLLFVIFSINIVNNLLHNKQIFSELLFYIWNMLKVLWLEFNILAKC